VTDLAVFSSEKQVCEFFSFIWICLSLRNTLVCININVLSALDKNSLKQLRFLRTFAGVLGEKIRMCAILKENTANYISLESLINVNFGKKIKFPVS